MACTPIYGISWLSGFLMYLSEDPLSHLLSHSLGINGNVTRQVVKCFMVFLSSILFCSVACSCLFLICHVNSFSDYPSVLHGSFLFDFSYFQLGRAKSFWIQIQCSVILLQNFIGINEIVKLDSQITIKKLNFTFQVGLCR